MDIPTKTEINCLLEDIMTCPINRRATVYVVLDSIKHVQQRETGDFKIDERVLVYQIVPSPGYPLNDFGQVKAVEHSMVKMETPAAMGHSLQRVDKLTPILEKIPLDPRPDDEVFLITWDHGSGFGVFRQDDPNIETPSKPTAVTDQIEDYPYLKLFWDRAMKEQELISLMIQKKKQPLPADSAVPEILKNKELAEIIGNWLGGRPDKKVGVLLMMNCWMMNLHTLYDLRDRVKYLVAPQGWIDSPGYNYRDILQSIYNSSPRPLDAEQLARNAVIFSQNDFFYQRAAAINNKSPNTLTTMVIINVRLDYPSGTSPFEEMLEKLQRLIDQLLVRLKPAPDKDFFNLLSFVRALSYDFTNNKAFLIDLPNYLQSLNTASGLVNPGLMSGGLGSAITNFMIATNDNPPVILPKYVGSNWNFTSEAIERWKLTGMTPTGFSIFFPTSSALGNPDPNVRDNIIDDELLKGPLANWKELVNLMYGPIIP